MAPNVIVDATLVMRFHRLCWCSSLWNISPSASLSAVWRIPGNRIEESTRVMFIDDDGFSIDQCDDGRNNMMCLVLAVLRTLLHNAKHFIIKTEKCNNKILLLLFTNLSGSSYPLVVSLEHFKWAPYAYNHHLHAWPEQIISDDVPNITTTTTTTNQKVFCIDYSVVPVMIGRSANIYI